MNYRIRGNKYGVGTKSARTCYQVHVHDSIKEARRCNELTLMVKGGAITKLKQQPEFELQPKFSFRGKSFRAIAYRADFSYQDHKTGMFIIEDAKGFKTEKYLLKKKLLLYIMRENEEFEFMET